MSKAFASTATGPGAAPFIIWTLRRTGGTNLAQSLFSHSGDGTGLHEPFNGNRVYAEVNKRWNEDQDPAALDAAVRDICSAGVRMKHCVEMVSPELNAALARAAQQHGYRHVFLYRRRSADRLLSLHFARTTGIWGKRAASAADFNESLNEPIPVEQLIGHQKRCDERLTAVYQTLLDLGAKPLSVAFEDVYMEAGMEPRQLIGSLLDGLSITPPDREQFITDVLTGGDQGTRSNYDQFPRRKELERKCNQLTGFAPEELQAQSQA